MEQAIVTSESGITKRTYILLILNILGVIGCVCTTILLTLWAQLLIFPEPNICPVIRDFLLEFNYRLPRISMDNSLFNINDLWDDTEPKEIIEY